MKRKPKTKNDVWKIAFADFMTALMCLFLMLWLLNSTPSSELQKVGKYIDAILSHGSIAHVKEEIQHTSNAKKDIVREKRGKFDALKLDLQQVIEGLEDKDLTYRETKEGLLISITSSKESPAFVQNSAMILKDDEIIEIAERLADFEDYQLAINCYNDAFQSFGSNNDPWKLGFERANAVRHLLLKHNVKEDSIESLKSFGDNVFLQSDQAIEQQRSQHVNYLQALNEGKSELSGKIYKAIEILVLR